MWEWLQISHISLPMFIVVKKKKSLSVTVWLTDVCFWTILEVYCTEEEASSWTSLLYRPISAVLFTWHEELKQLKPYSGATVWLVRVEELVKSLAGLGLTDLWFPVTAAAAEGYRNIAINSVDVLLYNSDPKGSFSTKIASHWI